jgi:hypothetical protein
MNREQAAQGNSRPSIAFSAVYLKVAVMSLAEIQRAVDTLPADEQLRLTAWMVSHYPLLRVEQLMAHAARLIDTGEWTPAPPTDDSRPKGKILEHALRTAAKLDLGK